MKKKVALSATAIAVLASTVPTHVAPVEATGNVIYVDSTKLSSNGDFSGAGTKDYPYRQLSTAIEKAQSGDTIIVIGEGYVNDLWDGTPWYIDKDITIRGEGSIPPTVSVRTPGIILGANVTFENVALGLANKTHDAIFANGHELNLINVSRAKGTRQVDLFAGGLAGATKYSAGNNPVINVITNNQFVGTINGEPVYSEFGGIYAGSMNGTYDKSAKIKVSNTGSTGILKVVSMHSSGAWQADPGNMLDHTEPALPQADPNTLVNYGDVEVTLENINLTVNGNTSPTATTTLKVIGKNFTSVNSNNIDNLELEGTTFTVSQNIFTNGLNQLTLSSNAILELTNYDEGNFEVSTYKGTGAIALPKQGVTVNIGNDFTSSDEVTFYLAGYNPFANSNGNATKNHVYFTTPSDNATINYEPSYVDEKLRLEPIQKGSRIEWTVIDPKNPPVTPDQPEPPKEEEGGDELPELPTITGFNISEQDKTLTKNVSEFNGPQLISIPFSVTTKEDLSNYYYLFLEEYEDLKVTVGEHEAVLTDDENDVSCFYVEDLNMYIYLQPTDEDDLSQQEITIEFKEDGIYVAPEVGTYNIGLSLNGQTLDTTLTIQGEDPDPVLPPTPPVDPEPEEPKDEEVVISEFRVSDSKVDVQANQSFQATYGFTVVGTKDETNIDLTKHPLEFSLGGSKAEYREATNDYYIADKGLTVKVNRVNGENTYQLVVSGFSQNLQMGDNTLTMGIKDTNVSTDLTLSVKPPTVTNVSFPDGSTKTVDVDKAKLGVEFQFGLGFTDEDHSPLDFKDIGYAVSINGKETVLNGVDYALADSDLKVTFTKKANGLWQAFLFKSDTDGNRLPLPVGTYNIKAVSESSQDFEFSIVVEEPTTEPDNKEEEKEEPTTPPSTDGGNNGGSSSGGGTQPTPPPSSGGSTGGNTGGTTTPPSTGGGNSGGSSSGGGTTTPPSTGGTQPTPPPSTGGTVTPTPTPTPTPVPPKQEVTNQVEGLKDLAKELQEKVDSLMTDISVQENGTILDLVGDSDDLSNVSTLEITKEGLFINVDGEKIKFNTSLDLSNIDWDNTRVLRVGGGPVPHKHNGEGISITTANFNNLLITSKEPEPFTDVNEDDWFKQYVEDAYNYGLVNGTTAETFDPDGAITRAQLAVILARAFELEPTSEDSALSDIGDKWYASEVQALVDAGIIKGFSDGTFGGDKPVTRQQMALMLTRTVQSQGKDVTLPTKAELDKVKLGGLDKTSEEASDAIKYLALMEAVMSGPDIDFRPNSIATRAQATKVLVNTLPRTGLY